MPAETSVPKRSLSRLAIAGSVGLLSVGAIFLMAYALGWLSSRGDSGYDNKQYSALQNLLTASSNASTALSGEDWPTWEKTRSALLASMTNMAASFDSGAFNGTIKQAVDAWPTLEKAVDFPHARTAYTRVSDNLAQIALIARKQDQRFATVHIFYCPMTAAPSNARWIQLSGNLHNPFWGKEMLDCGSEIQH